MEVRKQRKVFRKCLVSEVLDPTNNSSWVWASENPLGAGEVKLQFRETYSLNVLPYFKTPVWSSNLTRKTIVIPKSFQILVNCNLVVTDFSDSGVCQLRWMFFPREFYQNSSEEEISVQSMPAAKSNRSVSCSPCGTIFRSARKKKKKAKASSVSWNIK